MVESKFELFAYIQRQWMRREKKKKETDIIPSVLSHLVKPDGGSVMIWDCFSAEGV